MALPNLAALSLHDTTPTAGGTGPRNASDETSQEQAAFQVGSLILKHANRHKGESITVTLDVDEDGFLVTVALDENSPLNSILFATILSLDNPPGVYPHGTRALADEIENNIMSKDMESRWKRFGIGDLQQDVQQGVDSEYLPDSYYDYDDGRRIGLRRDSIVDLIKDSYSSGFLRRVTIQRSADRTKWLVSLQAGNLPKDSIINDILDEYDTDEEAEEPDDVAELRRLEREDKRDAISYAKANTAMGFLQAFLTTPSMSAYMKPMDIITVQEVLDDTSIYKTMDVIRRRAQLCGEGVSDDKCIMYKIPINWNVRALNRKSLTLEAREALDGWVAAKGSRDEEAARAWAESFKELMDQY